MSEQLVGHDDGLAEDGVRRLRRPPDWWQAASGFRIEANFALAPTSVPAIGDTVEIDAWRYRVLNVRPLDVSPIVAGTRYFEIDLDNAGEAPIDPLLPRAREIIERFGGAIEGLSARREGNMRHVSIHGKATWPGRTADVYGTGASDHEALSDLDDHMRALAP